MKFRIITLSAALLLAAATLWAEDPPRRPQPRGESDQPPRGERGQPPRGEPGQPGGPRPMRGDPIGESLFPPDMVMRAGPEIGLTDEQRESIQQEMQQAQGGFEGMHKRLQSESEALVAIMKQPRVDENQARSQMDKVLAAESEIKKTHLTLMIHIKNRLSPEQQAKLTEMKQHMMQQREGDRRPPPPDGERFAPEGGRRSPPRDGEGRPPGDGPQPGGRSERRGPPPDAPPEK